MSKVIDLKTDFQTNIRPKLKETLGIKNVMAVPQIKQIKINVGIGSYIQAHGKDFDNVTENIGKITGQKPVIAKATKAISNFKLREGMPVGISVTLRGKKMYDFLNKLIHIVFPRVRDFRGLSPKAFDGNGNYSMGFKEHVVFPEISPDDVMKLHGLQINISTTAKTDEHAKQLLEAFGFPFKKFNQK